MMAIFPKVFVKRLNVLTHNRGIEAGVSLNRFLIAAATVVVGVSAITGIVYFATRKCEWINVHLVPHSHNDVGWVKTPEEYYKYSVRWILSHVMEELQTNPQRKFVYMETYFFWKWWNEQTEEKKRSVRKLVKSGQLEIIGGGWTMSDEAVVHYQSFIDQSTWGFRRINDTLGSSAHLNIAWQIDTFGHSKELASLLALMGFDALFFARIDSGDRMYRRSKKLMEFIWDANRNLGSLGQIFTSIFYDHYSSPQGYDFETEPTGYPINLSEFAAYARRHADVLRTNNILVPMGDDFRFINARNYFQKIDELIIGFTENSDYKLNVFYSTPSQYIQALRKSRNRWPTFSGDFFPYGTGKHSYWTGYYTSRPSLKYLERIINNFLQITKQLFVFADLGYQFFNNLTVLREAMGTVQHHDAITGTAKQYVTNHYVELLTEGVEACSLIIDRAIKRLMGHRKDSKTLDFKSCLLLNISECPITTESDRFVVTVYNPLNRVLDYYVRFPVGKNRYSVRTPDGTYLKAQILVIPKTVLSIPGRVSSAKLELLFKATNIPPMGFKSYYVSASNKLIGKKEINKKTLGLDKPKVWFDERTGLLSSVTIKGKNLPLKQSIRHYISSHHWSGAYIFRPEDDWTVALEPGKAQLTVLNDGDLVSEYEQIFADWGSQIIRLYSGESHVEFEWLVGPIPVSDFKGKEIVLTYLSDVKNGNAFFTDLNGRRMEERIRDHRYWSKKLSEQVAGNYYPITTQISIKDDSTELHILTDRPQGGSSIAEGRIELMVHRRLCYDDNKGVNEPLNEEEFNIGLVTRGKHWLTFGNRNDEVALKRVKFMSQEKHSSPWLFFANAQWLPFETWANYKTEFSGLAQATPPNIRVLSLEPWTETSYLLRLEHIFDRSSRYTYSEPATISLRYLFENFVIIEARETTLGANKWLSNTKRTPWLGENEGHRSKLDEDRLQGNMTITVEPGHIRTFIIIMEPIK